MNSALNRPDDIHKGLATINGVEADLLSVADRATNYGHGLFETMLFRAGSVPLWHRHSCRLLSDAPALGISISKKSLEDNLSQFLKLLNQHSQNSGIIKIIISAGTGGRGYAAPDNLSAQIVCQFSSLPDNLIQSRREGVTLTQCQYRLPANPVLAGIKHLNRLDQVLARAEWADEYADGVMYSQEGMVIETTCANIFIKTAENAWITPKLDQSGVCGVMRGLLLERLFAETGLLVSEGHIGQQQLTTASELFICSSIRGLLPVTEINDLGHWSIGADTKMLQSALFDLYDSFPC